MTHVYPGRLGSRTSPLAERHWSCCTPRWEVWLWSRLLRLHHVITALHVTYSGTGAYVCFSTIHQSNVQLKNGTWRRTVPSELGEADVLVVSRVIPLTYSVITQCWALNAV